MQVYESPLCFECPIRARVRAVPEIAYSEPVQQLVGYVEEFVGYRDGFIDFNVGLDADLKQAMGDEYSATGGPCDADEEFVKQAYAARARILEYLDLLPAAISIETTLELGRCAHMLAAGQCAHTGVIPRYAEKLAEMKASGEVE